MNQCKANWQNEKKAYIPTSKQFKDLQNEVARYQKYASQLENKNKQLLEIGKRRLAEEPKSSAGEVLREVSAVIMKNKARVIGKCPTDREKELVMGDFKIIQEKLESAIRSQNILK